MYNILMYDIGRITLKFLKIPIPFAFNFINYGIRETIPNSIAERQHCVKSLQIRSIFWSIFSCIRAEYGDLLIIKI